jgi:aspartate-semialdehyde dehydrogenase
MAAIQFVAAVVGGTGQVGQHLVTDLLHSNKFSQIVLFSRRHIVEYDSHPKIKNASI